MSEICSLDSALSQHFLATREGTVPFFCFFFSSSSSFGEEGTSEFMSKYQIVWLYLPMPEVTRLPPLFYSFSVFYIFKDFSRDFFFLFILCGILYRTYLLGQGAAVDFKLFSALKRISVLFLHCFSYGYGFQS